MKLVSYLKAGKIHLGVIVNEALFALESLNQNLPNDMIEFVQLGNDLMLQPKINWQKLQTKV